MTIKAIWATFPISLQLFSKPSLIAMGMLQCFRWGQNIRKKKNIAEKWLEKMNQSQNSWNSLLVQDSKCRAYFLISIQALSPQCPHGGQPALWTFSVQETVQPHNCDILVTTKFIVIMNWNLPPSNFHPLVTVLCSGATHTKDLCLCFMTPLWLSDACLAKAFSKD